MNRLARRADRKMTVLLLLSFIARSLFFGYDSADRNVFPRHPTIPQHDRVGFVGGDALDHAAPTSRRFFERGCGACGEPYPVPSLDHQSLHYLSWPSVTLLADLFLGWTLIGWVAVLAMTAGMK